MNKIFLSRAFVAGWLVGLLAIQPVYSQEIEEADETADEAVSITANYEPIDQVDLATITNSAASFDSTRLILPAAEQKLWQTIEAESLLGNYDKRLITQTLPYLVDPESGLFDQIFAETINGYYEDDQKTSREFPGANQGSQRHTAKAGVVKALGTTSCGTLGLFARQLDPAKPRWVHYQLGQTTGLAPTWPFGRSFDAVARQMFALEGRAFTNRPMTAASWQDFLAQLAIGEIEERLALPPGVLANVELANAPTALAQARIAAALDMPILPEANAEADFYAALGQRKVEMALQLPTNSLVGETWEEIYQQLGFRVLEEQLGLPAPLTSQELFTGSTPLTDNPRFIALADQLAARSKFYQNPRLAFNLPSELDLPSGDQSPLDQRLINGDTAAFTIAGAWFLADSLNLSPNDSQRLVQAVAALEYRSPTLSSAKGFRDDLLLNQLFSADLTETKRQSLFAQLGQSYETTIEAALPRLNESVLLAMEGDNELPKLSNIIDTLTKTESRNTLLTELAKTSLVDSNYPDGLSLEALNLRGQALLAQALDLAPTDLVELQSPERSAAAKTTGQFIDQAMGWTQGTAFDWAQRSATTSTASLTIQEKRLLRDGANRLWAKLGFSGRLKAALNELYFQGVVTTDLTGFEPDFEDATPSADGTEEEVDQTDETTDQEEQPGDEVEGTDETVELAIPAEQQTLADAIALSLGLSLNDIEPLITGHWLPGLIRGTLAMVGRELSARANITGSQLIAAWEQPKAVTIEAIKGHGFTISQAEFLPPGFENRLEGATTNTFSQLMEETAAYQWNVTCPDKQVETREAIDKLVKALVDLPEIDETNPAGDAPNRPVQIISYSVEDLTDETRQAIKSAYPGADGFFRKWGAYGAERAWDHVFIGY